MTPSENSEHEIAKSIPQHKLLSRANIVRYLAVTLVFFLISFLYRILVSTASRPNSDLPPPSGPGAPSVPPVSSQVNNYWPIWGELFIPSAMQVIVGSFILIFFCVFMYYYYRRGGEFPFAMAVIVGIILIILTNLIQGPIVMASSIGGTSEIYWDAIAISSPLDFIANYNDIQPTLSVHAETQPPGAVLVIYLLTLVFPTPAAVAIAIAIISGLFSAFFVNEIFRHFLADDTARYGAFLYLLLPAVQVYYLANIYAIVATCMFGLFACYFQQDRLVRILGSLLFLFIGTFISFLFIVGPLGLLIYELLESHRQTKGVDIGERFRSLAQRVAPLFIICILTGIVYLLLNTWLQFNYIDAFLHASALENPDGFMLLANPIEYAVTRLQNVLDIAVFFGPILLVLLGTGLTELGKGIPIRDSDRSALSLVKGFLLSLFLLFIAGAPKKGETARICMFILPILLLPIVLLIQRDRYSWREKCTLLLLVFIQTTVMQLFGRYVW